MTDVEKTLTLAVEVLQESIQLGFLGVIFTLPGRPLPGSHGCIDNTQCTDQASAK